MAIPNNYIDKITNKDSGESRIISPAADKVRVDNENFEGTDLDEVLDEVAQAIGESGSGDGTVTGVKVGSTTYEPTDGVVDLSTPFGGKVDKNGTDSLMTAAEHTKLQNLPTNEQLTQQLDTKANDADVVKSISVETQGDGTVDINVGNDTYTINLNHTHEAMAKLVKCTEATLPQTMADDTIYVQVDNVTTPTEIEALHIFGLEFTGGGVPAGTPAITKPSGTTINLGTNYGSGVSVSKQIEIRANSHITGDLTVGLAANSDLSFDTNNLPSGVTYNSGAGTLTIAQATAIQGVNITIIYSGSGAAEIDGGLIITGGGASPKSVVVVAAVVPTDYVTNGLVFWLDGADASTLRWVDRIGGIAFEMHNVTINNDGSVSFNGTNSYGHYANTLGYTPIANTIEVVADMSFTKNQVIFMQNGDDMIVFGTGKRNSITGTATLPYSSGSTVKRQFNDAELQNKLMDGLQVFSISEPSGYRNKTKFTAQTDGYFGKRNEAGTFIGARTSTIDQTWFEGRIYQIRIYNRLLTENEILANQQVDIDRYNIS